MSNNPNLRYITLDNLMASVESDLNTFADEGMINRGQVIKVVRKVNDDLGLKINLEREAVIEVKNHKAELPADFMYLQLALMCGVHTSRFLNPAGDHMGNLTQEHQGIPDPHNFSKGIEIPVTTLCNPDKAGITTNDCGDKFWVTQLYKEKIHEFTHVHTVRLTAASLRFCAPNCMNLRHSNTSCHSDDHHSLLSSHDQHGDHNSPEYTIELEEGQVITGFEHGHLYLSYLADMTDKDGNIIILDHPLTTEYYEYAVKKHLLENWMLNSNADVAQKLVYIKNELRDARLRALSFVNTVEYSEIQKFYQANRNVFFNKYHKMFYESW